MGKSKKIKFTYKHDTFLAHDVRIQLSIEAIEAKKNVIDFIIKNYILKNNI